MFRALVMVSSIVMAVSSLLLAQDAKPEGKQAQTDAKIRHTWYYQGNSMGSVSLDIRGSS